MADDKKLSNIENLKNIPPITIDLEELAKIPSHKRMPYVLKKYFTGNNHLDKINLLRYLTNGIMSVTNLITENNRIRNYVGLVGESVSLFEMTGVINNVFNVKKMRSIDEGDEVDNTFSARLEYYIKDNYFSGEDMVDKTYVEASNILKSFMKLPQSIKDKYKIEINLIEDNSYSKTSVYKEALIFGKLNNDKFAMYFDTTYESLSNNKDNREVDNVNMQLFCLSTVNNNGLYQKINDIANAVFIMNIDPAHNYVRIDNNKYVIKSKLTIDATIRNIDFTDLTKSVKHVLDNDLKRGIVLIGNPGVGKTLCIHKLISEFPENVTFLINPDSINEPSKIRNLFKVIKDLKKCIVVFDDFDSADLEHKNSNTNEFLIQLDSTSEFTGFIIATVNDPSKIHPSLLNRPERFDEVILLKPPTKHVEIDDIISSKVAKLGYSVDNPDRLVNLGTEKEYKAFTRKMIKSKFTHAQVTGVVTACDIRYGEINLETLELSRIKMVESSKNSKLIASKSGELSSEDPDDNSGMEDEDEWNDEE